MRTDRGKNCSGPCLLCLLNQEDCCVASLISIEGDPSADEYSQIDLPSLHEMERTNYHKGLKRELTTGEWSAIKDVIDRECEEMSVNLQTLHDLPFLNLLVVRQDNQLPSEGGNPLITRPSSLPDTAEFILSTNLKNDVSIVGVAKGRIRDSKQDPWRDSYLVVYQLGAGPKKRAELNKDLYRALALVFDTILEINSPSIYDDIHRSWEEEVDE